MEEADAVDLDDMVEEEENVANILIGYFKCPRLGGRKELFDNVGTVLATIIRWKNTDV